MRKWLVLALLAAVLIRCMLGMWNYSGYGNSPMYGDFEAQRHWLEVTIALPIGDWYRHTIDNDLLYWGLDYPPLTAYCSYLFGKIASVLYPSLVEFQVSRGHESVEGKLFMRMTVVFFDLILYMPLIKSLMGALYQTKHQNNDVWYFISILVLLTTPSLLLIDHGHFQYNSVSIGLALYSLYFIIVRDWDVTGSIFFCLSLNYKQMSLYYSPIFFFILLRKCFDNHRPIRHFIKISSTVVGVFAILWSPFCVYHSDEETCLSSLRHVLHRQFPFARGIFEDKVRKVFSTHMLAISSIGLTLLLMAPACYLAFVYGTRRNKSSSLTFYLIILSNSALSYFLASFQVHEKSLLLVLVPLSLLVLDNPFVITWVQHIGTWTMFPLLSKDQLRVPYLIVSILYTILVQGTASPVAVTPSNMLPALPKWKFISVNLFILLSYFGMMTLHALEIFVPPPAKLPDIYPALFAIYGTLNLMALYSMTLYWIINFCHQDDDCSGDHECSSGHSSTESVPVRGTKSKIS